MLDNAQRQLARDLGVPAARWLSTVLDWRLVFFAKQNGQLFEFFLLLLLITLLSPFAARGDLRSRLDIMLGGLPEVLLLSAFLFLHELQYVRLQFADVAIARYGLLYILCAVLARRDV